MSTSLYLIGLSMPTAPPNVWCRRTWCQDPTMIYHDYLPPMMATAHHYCHSSHMSPPPMDGDDHQQRLLAGPCLPSTLDVRHVGGWQCEILLQSQRVTSTHYQHWQCRWVKLSPPSHSHNLAHNPGAMLPIAMWQPNDEQRLIGCSLSLGWHNMRTGQQWHRTTWPDSDDATTRWKWDDNSNGSHSSSHLADTTSGSWLCYDIAVSTFVKYVFGPKNPRMIVDIE